MAKKVDGLTGKEEIVSDEEMINAMQSGEGCIIQTMTMPDGTEKKYAAWGGYEYDGYDRTLNVFISLKDFYSFAKKLFEEDQDIKLDDPCKKEIGYQITIDFTDMAGTAVIRKGEGKATTALYERDERKTFQNAIEEFSGEIELDSDGTFSISGEQIAEELKSNKYMILFLSSQGLRRYLLKEGIVKKLYDMFDESAGVTVKVSKGGRITTKIVKGMERPDLPCNVFLLGEQQCRPYIDEMLNLKSSGVRNPSMLKKKLDDAKQPEKDNDSRAAKMTKITLLNHSLYKAEDEYKQREEKLKGQKEELKSLNASIEEYEERVKELEKNKTEIKNNIERIEAKLKQDKSDSEDEQEELQEKIDNNRDELKKIYAELEVQREIMEYFKILDSKGKKHDVYMAKKNKIEELEKDVDGRFGDIERYKAQIVDCEESIEKNKKICESETIKLHSDLMSTDTSLKNFKDNLRKAQGKSATLEKLIDKRKDRKKEELKEIKELKEQISALQAGLDISFDYKEMVSEAKIQDLDFLTPLSFPKLYQEIKGKNDHELIDMMSGKLEVILGTYTVNVDNGGQIGAYLLVMGTRMACDGLESINDAKKKAYAKVFSEYIEDESEIPKTFLGYKEKIFDALKDTIKVFDADSITRDTFLFLIAAACVGGENKKGIKNIEKLYKAWFD